ARFDHERAADPLRRGAMVAVRHLARGVQRDLLLRRRRARLDLAAQGAHIGGMTEAPKKSNRRTASMIRVDQAGEYGATRIYAGQLAVMGDRHPMAREIAHMAEQEERHRRFFDAMIARRGVRPTALQPVWNVAGFALGAVTAAMGPKAAMACTAAVETEIDRHYRHQLDEL